jgi:hypothetical protein
MNCQSATPANGARLSGGAPNCTAPQAGVSFLHYNTICKKTGGVGCLGSKDGCRFCRLSTATTELHLPLCPACVCKKYSLPAESCRAAATSPPIDPSPPPPGANECARASATGACCAEACFAAANPNPGVGVSYLEYAPSCRAGGLGCLGSNNGCRFCRLAKATTQLRLPLCAACVCARYGLPPDQCESGSLPGTPPPINWGEPILVENFDGDALNRGLFDVEVDCW